MARWFSLSLAAVLLLAASSYAADVTLGGYVQYQYFLQQTPEGEQEVFSQFGLKAARLKGSIKLTDKISAMALIDGARTTGSKYLSVLEANVDYAQAPYLILRAGQFQVPFGYETQNSNFDVEAIDRSQIVGQLWDNGTIMSYLRDQGLMLMGQHKLLNYKVAVVNGTGLNTADNNNHKDVVGRVGVGIPMFAGLGVSMLRGQWPNDIGEGVIEKQDRNAYGVDLYLDTGKILLETEYIKADGMVTSTDTIDDVKFSGWYVILGYRVTPLVEPVFKIDKFDPNNDEDEDQTTNYHFGVNLNFEGKARLQAFYVVVGEPDCDNCDLDNNQFILQMKAKF